MTNFISNEAQARLINANKHAAGMDDDPGFMQMVHVAVNQSVSITHIPGTEAPSGSAIDATIESNE